MKEMTEGSIGCPVLDSNPSVCLKCPCKDECLLVKLDHDLFETPSFKKIVIKTVRCVSCGIMEDLEFRDNRLEKTSHFFEDKEGIWHVNPMTNHIGSCMAISNHYISDKRK